MSGPKKTAHFHGCRGCRIRYEDACATPKQNGLCSGCRGGRPWWLLINYAKPRDCCVATSRLASKDEIRSYSLAGEASWWICAKCKRTQVYRPTDDDVFTEEKS